MGEAADVGGVVDGERSTSGAAALAEDILGLSADEESQPTVGGDEQRHICGDDEVCGGCYPRSVHPPLPACSS